MKKDRFTFVQVEEPQWHHIIITSHLGDVELLILLQRFAGRSDRSGAIRSSSAVEFRIDPRGGCRYSWATGTTSAIGLADEEEEEEEEERAYLVLW